MKIFTSGSANTWLFACVLFVLLLTTASVLGQSMQVENGPAAPEVEKFSPQSALAVPWRDSGCNRFAVQFRQPGCTLVSGDEWANSHQLELYNSDGTLWFRFSANSAAHLTELKPDFVPFAVPYFNVVALRLIAESPDWFEVEVNETSRETKFARKGKAMWGKTTYEHWIYESDALTVEGQKLLEKPNGRQIKIPDGFEFDRVNVERVDGDWVYVHQFGTPDGYRGWIRWRDGRKISVGCLLNHDARWKQEEFTRQNPGY